jgi:hypothetical protein
VQTVPVPMIGVWQRAGRPRPLPLAVSDMPLIYQMRVTGVNAVRTAQAGASVTLASLSQTQTAATIAAAIRHRAQPFRAPPRP